jgi:hypothetical protein
MGCECSPGLIFLVLVFIFSQMVVLINVCMITITRIDQKVSIGCIIMLNRTILISRHPEHLEISRMAFCIRPSELIQRWDLIFTLKTEEHTRQQDRIDEIMEKKRRAAMLNCLQHSINSKVLYFLLIWHYRISAYMSPHICTDALD